MPEPQTMKVARLYGAGDIRIEDEPLPVPQPGEVMVKIDAVSICGSDLHWFTEGGIGPSRAETRGVVLGHEMAGVIARGPRSGERVALDPAIPCGICEHCLEGNPNFCTSLRFAGDGTQDGGLREYAAWPERSLFHLPDQLSAEEGALLEPLGVALHSLNLAHVRPGMRAGVYGCGPIGLLIIQLARLSGAAQIVATDCLAHRLEAARACGATDTFLSTGGGENEAVWRATGGHGMDVSFEAAGENPAVETAFASARAGSRVVLVGIPGDDHTSFTASTARR
ncbi:MAG TPA: alcohol dehydrogenase catalytic domain-containing protein, partial [Anaerolineaceae bacterium]